MINTILNIFVLEHATEDVETASHANTIKVQSSTGASVKLGDDLSETATANSKISDDPSNSGSSPISACESKSK